MKFLIKNFNQGNIYSQVNIYIIIKFLIFELNSIYLILFISFTRKTKKIQKKKINTTCQNLAKKQIIVKLFTILVRL